MTISPTPTGIGITAFSAGSRSAAIMVARIGTPSTLIANNVVDIYVGRTTKLLGAIVNSRSNNLTLDTGHLVYDNLRDKDRSYSFNASVSWSASAPFFSDKPGKPHSKQSELQNTFKSIE